MAVSPSPSVNLVANSNAIRPESTLTPHVEVSHQAGLESFYVGVFSGEQRNENWSKSAQTRSVARCENRREKASLPHSGTGPRPHSSARLHADLANVAPSD